MTIDDYARFESFETYDFITVNYFFYEGEKLIFEESIFISARIIWC